VGAFRGALCGLVLWALLAVSCVGCARTVATCTKEGVLWVKHETIFRVAEVRGYCYDDLVVIYIEHKPESGWWKTALAAIPGLAALFL
jgi:hypothetical protein